MSIASHIPTTRRLPLRTGALLASAVLLVGAGALAGSLLALQLL